MRPQELIPRIQFKPILLLAIIVLLFLEPSMALGRSAGWLGVFFLLGYLTISFGAATATACLACKNPIGRNTLTVILTFVFYLSSLMVAQTQWQVLDPIAQSKIEYHCFVNFRQDQCVLHVNACPRCALNIDRWKRLQIAEKLKEYRKTYSPSNQAKALEWDKKRRLADVSQ